MGRFDEAVNGAAMSDMRRARSAALERERRCRSMMDAYKKAPAAHEAVRVLAEAHAAAAAAYDAGFKKLDSKASP